MGDNLLDLHVTKVVIHVLFLKGANSGFTIYPTRAHLHVSLHKKKTKKKNKKKKNVDVISSMQSFFFFLFFVWMP